MKKLFLFFLVGTVLAGCGKKASQDTNSEDEKAEIVAQSANFKKCTVKTYDVSFQDGEMVKSLVESEVIECDANGDTLSRTTYDYLVSDGTLYSQYLYTYDEHRNLISEIENAPIGYWTQIVYTYDARGNRLSETQCYADGSFGRKWVYNYDNRGKVVEKTEYDSDSVFCQYLYTYDEKGNQISGALGFGDSLDDMELLFVCTYDEEGHLLNHRELYSEGWSFAYTYDEHGNILSETLYFDSEGIENYFEKYIYTYDEQGRKLSKTEYNSVKEVDDKSLYTYDEHGNILSEKRYKYDGTLFYLEEYEYEY